MARGTPDNVCAEVGDSKDADGRRTREIILKRRNAAGNGQTVFWDIEMKDGEGRVIPQRAWQRQTNPQRQFWPGHSIAVVQTPRMNPFR